MSDIKLKKEVKRFYEGKEGIDHELAASGQIRFIEGGYNEIVQVISSLIGRSVCGPG